MFQSTLLTCQLIKYLSISHFLLSVWQLIIISTVEGNYVPHGVGQATAYLKREHSVSLFPQCLLLLLDSRRSCFQSTTPLSDPDLERPRERDYTSELLSPQV